jgi:hypothetical protein
MIWTGRRFMDNISTLVAYNQSLQEFEVVIRIFFIKICFKYNLLTKATVDISFYVRYRYQTLHRFSRPLGYLFTVLKINFGRRLSIKIIKTACLYR